MRLCLTVVTLATLAAASLSGGCAGARREAAGTGLRRFTRDLPALGTNFHVVLYAPDARTADAATDAAATRLAKLDAALNPDRADGELRRLCDAAGGPPRKIGEDLFTVLLLAQRVSRRSGGAFDVTAGAFEELWRRAAESGGAPTEGQLEDARKRVGWEKLRLDTIERTASLAEPGMRPDLACVARGYSADHVIGELLVRGVDRARAEIAAGGPTGKIVVVSGPPPGRAGWEVPYQTGRPPRPRRGRKSKPPRVLSVANAAVAVSANAPGAPGAAASWLVDPLTGKPVADGPVAVVVARRGSSAAPLAAAAAVLGREAGGELVRSAGGRAHFQPPAR